MRDHGTGYRLAQTSHNILSPDYVFRPHRYQPCFLKCCDSSNGWIGWGFKSLRNTCIRSSFQYSHCGVLSGTMDQTFALQEPHQFLIIERIFLLDYLVVVAVWQSIAYLLESGGLHSQDPCILGSLHPWILASLDPCILGSLHPGLVVMLNEILISLHPGLVVMLNESFVTNSSPSNGSITMDQAEAHCGVILGST